MTNTKIEYIVAHNAYYYDGAMWIYPFAPPHHTMIAPSYFNPTTDPNTQTKTVDDLIAELQRKIDEHKHDLEKQQTFLDMLLSVREQKEQPRTNQYCNEPQSEMHTEQSIIEEHKSKNQISNPVKSKRVKKKKVKSQPITKQIDHEPVIEVKIKKVDEWITPKKCSKPIDAPESAIVLAQKLEEPLVERPKEEVEVVVKKPHKKKLKKQVKRIEKQKEEIDNEPVKNDDELRSFFDTITPLRAYKPQKGSPSQMYRMLDNSSCRRLWLKDMLRYIKDPILGALGHYRTKQELERTTGYPGIFIVEIPFGVERFSTTLLTVYQYSGLAKLQPGTVAHMAKEFECGVNLIANLNLYQWDDKSIENFFRKHKINSKHLKKIHFYILYEKQIVYQAMS
jgi:hypothetical protein